MTQDRPTPTASDLALGPAHRRLRILLSFHYYPEGMASLIPANFTPPYPDIFADSGGYSAETLGTPIRVQDYAEWLHKNKAWFSAYANLDSIRSVDETLRNQQYLEDQGLHPIPVFHVGEPWSVLADLIEDYPYIALGGLVSNRQAGAPALARFMVRAFRMAEGLSVYHGFGMTTWRMLKALPWYSVDSSSWGSGYRYGSVALFDPRLGKFQQARLGDVQKWRKMAPLVRQFGYNPTDFMVKGQVARATICAVSALTWLQAEGWLRSRHGNIPLMRRGKWRDYTISELAATGYPSTSENVNGQDQPPGDGFRVYVADGAVIHWTWAQTGIRIYLADTSGSAVSMDAGTAAREVRQAVSDE